VRGERLGAARTSMNPLNVREPTTTYIYDDLGRLIRGLMMKSVELDFLKRHLASTIIKRRFPRGEIS
jgi:hypothetical protein